MGDALLPRTAVRLALETAAAFVGLDANLVKAVAHVESSWNPKAKSPKGAKGLMQLMAAVCKDEGVTDPLDPMQNAIAGSRFLKKLIKRFGDVRLALAAYNWGPRHVQEKHLNAGGAIPLSVQGYVDKVLARLELERTSVGLAASAATQCDLCGQPLTHCSPAVSAAKPEGVT